jgi:prepilin-type N-terminal cleavage/methylation domain-containing protein
MRHLDERGVSMIEVLIAVMLLAIALTGLAASYPVAMQAVTGGGYQTAATLLAQQCIELAKSMPYDRLTIDLPPNCPASPGPGYAGFSRTLTVAPAQPSATTTTITVEVDFHNAQGLNQTAIATILSQ